jgi:hypothetical protein
VGIVEESVADIDIVVELIEVIVVVIVLVDVLDDGDGVTHVERRVTIRVHGRREV